jgi:spore maturation protein CgeB
MRILLVDGGAPWATWDVYTGLSGGLKAGGHLVWEYALGARLDASHDWLQLLWKKQREAGGPLAGVEPTPNDEQHHASEGTLARALRHEADWVVVVSGMFFHLDVAECLRRAGLRTAVVFTESPYDDEKQARAAPYYDVCFTQERASVPFLREANPNTHYLPAAYDPATHAPGRWWLDGPWEPPADRPFDVVFVGTGFSERMELLAGVDWSGIDLRLYGYWDDVPKRHPLAPYLHPGLVDNATTGRLYRRARIGLNLYRDAGAAGAESLNPRAYELAADGVFTISHRRAEVSEKFGPLVPTFDTPRELETLCRHFLKNEAARRDAAAGLSALVEHDTYHHRAAQLVAHLTERAEKE